jgi:hypothetical protein
MTDVLTRKRFVGRGVIVLGALAAPARALAAKRPKTQTVYRLHPKGGKGDACKACVRHAANNLFPTRKAANGNRAHKGCDCQIQAGKIDYETYVALFGPPAKKKKKRYRADKRKPAIRAILKKHPARFP